MHFLPKNAYFDGFGQINYIFAPSLPEAQQIFFLRQNIKRMLRQNIVGPLKDFLLLRHVLALPPCVLLMYVSDIVEIDCEPNPINV